MLIKDKQEKVSKFKVKKFVSYVKSSCLYVLILSDIFESCEIKELVK